jgi:hypothetical protein
MEGLPHVKLPRGWQLSVQQSVAGPSAVSVLELIKRHGQLVSCTARLHCGDKLTPPQCSRRALCGLVI